MTAQVAIDNYYEPTLTTVRRHVEIPFEPFPFQEEAIELLSPDEGTGLYHDPGLGKTFTSMNVALHKLVTGQVDQIVVIMPPILDRGWRKAIAQFRFVAGPAIRVVSYRGTPAQRRKITFDADVVLMSMQIFKRDYERVAREMGGRRLHVILDEATSIKNVGSDNHRFFREFVAGNPFEMLTGTPLTTPMDGYAYVKLLAPDVYRSLAQFKRIHVLEYDFYDKPLEWTNLDLLRENMALHASFVRKEDVLKDLPGRTFTTMEYELDPQHMKLYRRLVEEQLLQLPDGSKIDATQATKLRHALGQIVLSWGHFAGDDRKVSAGFNLIEQVLEELGDRKLVVFANYRLSNRQIAQRFQDKFGAVAVFGDVSPSQKEKNLARFINDPRCRLITMQPGSGGVGVDGLQDVASDILFIEPPLTPTVFTQALSRLWRSGQLNNVHIRTAMALGTLQVRGVESLVEKEELVNPVQYSKTELREMLLGG